MKSIFFHDRFCGAVYSIKKKKEDSDLSRDEIKKEGTAGAELRKKLLHIFSYSGKRRVFPPEISSLLETYLLPSLTMVTYWYIVLNYLFIDIIDVYYYDTMYIYLNV